MNTTAGKPGSLVIEKQGNSTTDNWSEVRREAMAQLPQAAVDFIGECRRRPHSESYLIAVLHRVQDHFGYLGERQLDAVSQLMQIPQAKVAGVASFYHFFRLVPRGEMVVNICLGTACYVKGAEKVAARFKQELGIEYGETTTDGMFSLEPSRCLGTCGLAPVIMVEGKIYGHITPDQVPALIEKLIKKGRGKRERGETRTDRGRGCRQETEW